MTGPVLSPHTVRVEPPATASEGPDGAAEEPAGATDSPAAAAEPPAADEARRSAPGRVREVAVRRVGEVFVRELRMPGPPGPVFVLVHGAGLSSRYLLPLARRLAAHGQVLLLDLPASRGLPAPPAVLSVPEQAELVHQVVAASGVREAVLVGHSMGAQVVVAAMARRPETYDRAVLVGPPVNARERRLGRQVLRYVQSAVHEPSRVVRLAARAYLATTTRWLVDVVPVMLAYRIEDAIARLSPHGRVVIVRGEHDTLVPADWCETLARRSGAPTEVVTVPGAAHTVLVDHPDVVAAAARAVAAP
ncbi:alpha/beta fold hydrolase [Georgenia muralis]|uniref:Alpha-beta hydrolase superfamily lysophospholipase n=1 Tax=Georgenia muralis TaxID=154117 RepID=A0A3N5A706_9MICO|nr:alpha/beta hydrolase [Georgenia muralis]RPF27481.1 alpha-beta hydrolase superfamily lysophospholipase [Georgenia muralis]